MFDNYIYKAERNGAFLAGYTTCALKGDLHPSFLFTTLRIVRVLSGDAQWKIGSKIHHIKKGDIVVVNNLEPRQFLKTSDDNFVCEIFALSPGILGAESYCFSLFYNHTDKFNPIINQTIKNTHQIHTLLDLIKEKFAVVTPHNQIVIQNLIISVIADILDLMDVYSHGEQIMETNPNVSSANIVVRSIEYINQNLTNNLFVSTLSENAGISREYFCKIFRKYTGTTPSSFINRCKINNVIHLITTKDINILDAAFESGFSTSSGFYKTFKELCGMSPKEFLKKTK